MISLSDLLSLMGFLTDKPTLRLIKGIALFAERFDSEWRRQIKFASRSFSEEIEVDVFAHFLVEELMSIEFSPQKIADFKIVFKELVRNAFIHGRKKKKGKVRIRCTFSKWFVKIEVKDPGRGFDLSHVLEKGKRWSGLKNAKLASAQLYTNKKGNVVTAIIHGDNTLKVKIIEKRVKGQTIAFLRVKEPKQFFMSYRFEELRDVAAKIIVSRVVFDFGGVSFPSDTEGQFWDFVRFCSEIENKKFALIWPRGAEYLDDYSDMSEDSDLIREARRRANERYGLHKGNTFVVRNMKQATERLLG